MIAQRAWALTGSYIWILQSTSPCNTGTSGQGPLPSLRSIEKTKQGLQICSLAEQPHLPYVMLNTLWSLGSTLNPFWYLEDLIFTSSSQLPCTKPELGLTLDCPPAPPDLKEMLGALGSSGVHYSCARAAQTDESGGEGPGFSQYARTDCHRGIFIHTE